MAISVRELEDQFDVLYNSITSNQAPGLDIYEKSVFLTKAQTDVILSYFHSYKNRTFQGYDGSIERQADFSKLTRVKKTLNSDMASGVFDTRSNTRSVVVDTTEVFLILNEFVNIQRVNSQGKNEVLRLTVLPMEFNEYNRMMSKPFKRPLHYQAWRLINFGSESFPDSQLNDLIVGPSDTISDYTVRYVKKPNPIILGNLDDLTIEGYSDTQKIEIDDILIPAVLQRAVELAKASYTGGLSEIVQLGGMSQTDISDSAKSALSQQQRGGGQ